MLVIVSVVFHYSPGQFAEIFNYTRDGLLQECPALPDQPGRPQWSEDFGFPMMLLYHGDTDEGPGVTLPLLSSWVQLSSPLRPLENEWELLTPSSQVSPL